jgi:manganese transport protein
MQHYNPDHIASDQSLADVNESVNTNVQGSWFKRLLAFLGPAYLVSVGYMDPGNWATDLAGGSQFGYTLLWVLVMSNLIALLLQSMSARLGVVARRDLAQASRELYPPAVNYFLYFLAEIAIAATDLAEVLGMAIGLKLLFNMPLMWGVAISIFDTFLMLMLMRWGIRKLEAFIIALIAVIGVAFAIQIVLAQPSVSAMAGGLVPSIPNEAALYIAIAIIGATVMPHNLYLHSALVQTRKVERTNEGLRRAIRFNVIDSAIALNLALFVNAAILILAASTFHKNGFAGIESIEDAHRLLEPLLGANYAPVLFAVALIAAGQSSTVTGTLAGQIVMEGYLRLRIAPWLRRIITRLLAVLPALLVIHYMGEAATEDMLVFSQVILSMQLGFAVIPLLHYVSDRRRMGVFAIGPWTKAAGWTAAAIIVALNIKLVIGQTDTWLQTAGQYVWVIRWLVIPLLLTAGGALVYVTLKPLIARSMYARAVAPHKPFAGLGELTAPNYEDIVIALDFSDADQKTIQHAIQTGGLKARYYLFHSVESVGAVVMGADIQDEETAADRRYLAAYAEALTAKGYQVEAVIGYGTPKRAIPRFIEERSVDLLVMGAHGHRMIKDLIFGATVDAVRHAVDIPVLIVR